MLDIDGLKRVNDAHGHAAGDRVLVQVAMAMRRSIRTVDTPARIGGDEFCVLAPHQDAEARRDAGRAAGRGRSRPRSRRPTSPRTLSIGVVSCPEHGDDAEALLEIADQAMYRAKAGGEPVRRRRADGSGDAEEPRAEH